MFRPRDDILMWNILGNAATAGKDLSRRPFGVAATYSR
jgi:hypothetical protein